jgi:hypothetical protein
VLCLIYPRSFDVVVAMYDSDWYIKRLFQYEVMSFAMKYVSVTSRRMIKTVTSVPCVLSLRKFNGCNHDLVDRYGVSVSQITTDQLHPR